MRLLCLWAQNPQFTPSLCLSLVWIAAPFLHCGHDANRTVSTISIVLIYGNVDGSYLNLFKIQRTSDDEQHDLCKVFALNHVDSAKWSNTNLTTYLYCLSETGMPLDIRWVREWWRDLHIWMHFVVDCKTFEKTENRARHNRWIQHKIYQVGFFFVAKTKAKRLWNISCFLFKTLKMCIIVLLFAIYGIVCTFNTDTHIRLK